jgi:lipoprotein-anchoring transpeptidase ErfK/SrfK
MSFRHATSSRPHAPRRHSRRWAGAAVAALALVATGCSASADDVSSTSSAAENAAESPTAPPVSEASISSNVRDEASDVSVDTVLELSVEDGTFTKVKVRSNGEGKKLPGALSDDGATWTASSRLEPGLRYRVRTVAEDEAGVKTRKRTTFTSEDLTLDEQTFPSIAPLEGETVGVGMPVIVKFDVPVTDRAAIERHLSVDSEPAQPGAWSWLSDNEVHFRPKKYWKPGTSVTVNADINSIPAGNGVYGQLSRSTTFKVGTARVSKVNVDAHRMRVFENGKLLRTIPVTAGKDGFTTRSGTKVIMEKERRKTMDASTIGIDKSDSEYYRIKVQYAMRVTYSGEFIHGAPWSQGSQGSDNVSHGCVGMSLKNAAWLFDRTRRGDVVVVTGTNRTLERGNGYTDWDVSFQEFKEGSALS